MSTITARAVARTRNTRSSCSEHRWASLALTQRDEMLIKFERTTAVPTHTVTRKQLTVTQAVRMDIS